MSLKEYHAKDPERKVQAADADKYVEDHGGNIFAIPTADGRHLEGAWVPGINAQSDGPSIALFHGNSMTWREMINHAEFYHTRGLNVLMVTMGGYPSDPNIVTHPIKHTTPESSFFDAQAIIDVLKSKGSTKIAVHGFSIGGTLACEAAYKNPGVHLVADQTLESFTAVSKNIVGDASIVALATRALQKAIFPDDLHNADKVHRMQGYCLVFGTNNDHLMNKRDGTNAAHGLAESFITGHPGSKIDDTLVMFPGGHGAFFGTNRKAAIAADRFLEKCGMLLRKP